MAIFILPLNAIQEASYEASYRGAPHNLWSNDALHQSSRGCINLCRRNSLRVWLINVVSYRRMIMSRILFLLGYLFLPLLLLCSASSEAVPLISRDHQAVATLIIILVLMCWIGVYLLIRPVAMYYFDRFTRMGRDGKELGKGLSLIFCILMCMYTLSLLQG